MIQCESTGCSSSLRHKLKSSICVFCCFNNNSYIAHHHDHDEVSSEKSPRSLYALLKLTAPEEIRYKCRGLIAKIGRCRRSQVHVSSADFRYDPMSYALNFEDDQSRGSDDEEFPLRNFSARLPVSPERLAPSKCVAARGEVLACECR